MRYVEVDTDILRTQINQLEVTLARTRLALDKLNARVESLQSMWNGPAHDEFNKQYLLDRQRMENMCRIIQNIIDGMQQARLSYDRCTDEVDSVVGSIRG